MSKKVKTETQITQVHGYDPKSRMIFSEPINGTIPDSKPPINYKRVNISTRNEDGSIGELIIPTSRLFSFGVQENINVETGKINGHVMPLCLYNRDGATKEEKDFVETMDAIAEVCKEWLIENREEIEKYDLERNDLKKFNPIYWKRDKGKIVEGTGPTLYAKLISSKKQDKILTMYYDKNGDTINPLDLIGKYCFAESAIKIESIFIGQKPTLQVKLYECEVEIAAGGMQRLLKRPESEKTVRMLTKKVAKMPLISNDDDDDDAAE